LECCGNGTRSPRSSDLDGSLANDGIEFREEWIAMPDAVRLAADLWVPEGGDPDQKYPVLLEYLPYRKNESRTRNYGLFSYFGQRGYVIARVGIRGSGNSEGKLIEYEYTDQEQEDGEVVIGGWYKGYRDSVPRMLEHMDAPVKAMVGPWAHSFPHNGYPKPQMEWRHEAVRWDRMQGMCQLSVDIPANTSPEALKYYSEGLQYFLRGDFRRSITFLEKALAVDPDRSFSGTTDSFGTV